jgi:hypothetical protein
MKQFLVVLFTISLSGCIVIDTPGFYSGYKKLSPEQQQKITFLNEQPKAAVCDLQDKNKVYAVTAQELIDCLKLHDSSLVYFWSPHCHSTSCISLGAAEKYSNENRYKLFIVADYYDMEQLGIQNNTIPVLSVNHKFYKTDYCNKYMKRFKNELLKDRKIPNSDKYKRFVFFRKDQYTIAKDSIL